MEKQKVIVTGPQEGKTIAVVGDTYRILVSGDQNEGRLAVFDMLIPSEGGPGPHAHPDFDETIYIIEGELVIRSEGQEPYVAKQGAFVQIPKGGVVHNFKNESNSVAHIILSVSPAGLEDFFLEIGQDVQWGKFLPVREMTPKKEKELQKIAENHGQKLFPPDYLTK